MKITIDTTVDADLAQVWNTWNNPDDIKQWKAASEVWHTTSSRVDLREGGTFSARMEARDGSAGFDMSGTYTRVDEEERIDFAMEDGRVVTITFEEVDGGVRIRETFDAEDSNEAEQQRMGWQAVPDSFAAYTEAKYPSGK